MFATRRILASAVRRRLSSSASAGRIPAWDTSRHQVRSFVSDSGGVGGVVGVTKTAGSSSHRTPIANAGGADANRPSISTDESTCSHGISTDPNLLDSQGDDEDDEMEDMFVEPDAVLEHRRLSGVDPGVEAGSPNRPDSAIGRGRDDVQTFDVTA
eukprot:CAMPEP_0197715054 /NCGR_PEP_ID=MMETSP1434-20131217/207_1 /TAXON_ID=265543 /ORGANISM="Minutocellus polymorphus, Strain CCMP3303" /LENGTH=155 /DNA_ID=CAMNT_0043299041 /DNA_START=85 /DNA_END=553 /DNA_ORIENTATION=+